MKILRVIATIDSTGGGPMEGARKIDAELIRRGHFVEVVCLSERDVSVEATYPVKVHALGPSKSSFQFNAKLAKWLEANINRFDVLIVNGLWQYHGYAARRAALKARKPYFVFTHGMLDPWFKRNYPLKHLKKWLYWPWGEYRNLRDATGVLFTTDEERILARQSFWLYKCRELTTSYGTSLPPQNAELKEKFFLEWPELRSKKLILFLSRIHEKKGCDLLIEAFSKISNDAGIHLLMAGPDHTGLKAKLVSRAAELGVGNRITWLGMLAGDAKWGAFQAAEVFCLPSHQENFGIAVAESLACGTPVLITNKVNIWREVAAADAGFVEDDTLDGVTKLLRRWLGMTSGEIYEMGERGRACFKRSFNIDAVVDDLIVNFNKALV